MVILDGAFYPGAAPGYSPVHITIVIGVNNTVIWTNNDSATHTVTSDAVPAGAPLFNSGIINSGGTYIYTFTVPGSYHYYCELHGWMFGAITVKSE